MDKLIHSSNPFLNDQTKDVIEKLPTVSSLSAFLATLNQTSNNSRLKRFLDETGSLDVNISETHSCHLSDISSVSNTYYNQKDDYDGEEDDDNESLGCETNASFDNIIDSASSYRSEDGSIGEFENDEKYDKKVESSVNEYIDIVDRVNNNYINDKKTDGHTEIAETSKKKDVNLTKTPLEEEIKKFMSLETNNTGSKESDQMETIKNNHKKNSTQKNPENIVNIQNGYEEEDYEDNKISLPPTALKVVHDSETGADIQMIELIREKSLIKIKSPNMRIDKDHYDKENVKEHTTDTLVCKSNEIINNTKESINIDDHQQKINVFENKFIAKNLQDLKMNNEILQSSNKPQSSTKTSLHNTSKASKVTLEFFCSKVGEDSGEGVLRLKDTFRLHKLQDDQMDNINTISELFKSHTSELKNNSNSVATNKTSKGTNAKSSDNDNDFINTNINANINVTSDSISKALNLSQNTPNIQTTPPSVQTTPTPLTSTLPPKSIPVASRRTVKNNLNKSRVFPGMAKRVGDKSIIQIHKESDKIGQEGKQEFDTGCVGRVSKESEKSREVAEDLAVKFKGIPDKAVKEDDLKGRLNKTEKLFKELYPGEMGKEKEIVTRWGQDGKLKGKEDDAGDRINKRGGNCSDSSDHISLMKKSKTIDFCNEDIESRLYEIRSLLYGVKSSQEVCKDGENDDCQLGRIVYEERSSDSNEMEKISKVSKSKSFHTNPFYGLQMNEKAGNKSDEIQCEQKIKSKKFHHSESMIDQETGVKQKHTEKEIKVVNNDNKESKSLKINKAKSKRLNETKNEIKNKEGVKEQKVVKESKNGKEAKKLSTKKMPGMLKKVVSKQKSDEEKLMKKEKEGEREKEELKVETTGVEIKQEKQIEEKKLMQINGSQKDMVNEEEMEVDGFKKEIREEKWNKVDETKKIILQNETKSRKTKALKKEQLHGESEEKNIQVEGELEQVEGSKDDIIEKEVVINNTNTATTTTATISATTSTATITATTITATNTTNNNCKKECEGDSTGKGVPSAGAAMTVIDELLEELRRSHMSLENHQQQHYKHQQQQYEYNDQQQYEYNDQQQYEYNDQKQQHLSNDQLPQQHCNDLQHQQHCSEQQHQLQDFKAQLNNDYGDGDVVKDDGYTNHNNMAKDEYENKKDDGDPFDYNINTYIGNRLYNYSKNINEYLGENDDAEGDIMMNKNEGFDSDSVVIKSSKNPFINSDNEDIEDNEYNDEKYGRVGDYGREGNMHFIKDSGGYKNNLYGDVHLYNNHLDIYNNNYDHYEHHVYDNDYVNYGKSTEVSENIYEEVLEKRAFTLSPEFTDCESVMSIVSRNDSIDAYKNGPDDDRVVDDNDDDKDDDEEDEDENTSPSYMPNVVDGLSSNEEDELDGMIEVVERVNARRIGYENGVNDDDDDDDYITRMKIVKALKYNEDNKIEKQINQSISLKSCNNQDDDNDKNPTQHKTITNNSNNRMEGCGKVGRKVLRHDDKPLPNMAYKEALQLPQHEQHKNNKNIKHDINNKNNKNDISNKSNSDKHNINNKNNKNNTDESDLNNKNNKCNDLNNNVELKSSNKCNSNGRVYSKTDDISISKTAVGSRAGRVGRKDGRSAKEVLNDRKILEGVKNGGLHQGKQQQQNNNNNKHNNNHNNKHNNKHNNNNKQ